jgi:hypothetical protein
MPWKPMLVLATLAFVAPAWAEEPKPDAAAAAATTTTTLGGHRGYPGVAPNDPRGLPTGLPGFSSPPMPIDEKKPSHEPPKAGAPE